MNNVDYPFQKPQNCDRFSSSKLDSLIERDLKQPRGSGSTLEGSWRI